MSGPIFLTLERVRINLALVTHTVTGEFGVALAVYIIGTSEPILVSEADQVQLEAALTRLELEPPSRP